MAARLPRDDARSAAFAGCAKALIPALVILVGARVTYWLAAAPNSDEAYYWLWGLHPDLSYFDHPPLNAWIQGLVHAVLGESRLALRLPAALTTVGSVWLLGRLAARLTGEVRAGPALVAAVVLASPLFLMLTSFAWNDHLLIFLVLVAASLFLEVLAEVAGGGRGSTWQLLAGGFALGLAALAKYSAVFLAVGILVAVATEPRLRRLFRDPRLYLAALVCLAAMATLLIWNADHNWASFRFHTEGHYGGTRRPGVVGLLHFLVPTLLALSPGLAWAMLAEQVEPVAAATSYATVYRRLARAVFFASSGTFAVLSLFSWTIYYWNVVAYLLLLAPAAGLLASRPRLMRWHLGLGCVAALAMAFHAVALPLSALWAGIKDDDSFEVFGWEEVAAGVREARSTESAEMIVTNDYRTGAHLGWALERADVVVLSGRPSQFDYWFNPNCHLGSPALIVTDGREPMNATLASRFAHVAHVRTIPIFRLGVHLKEYELWRAEGFRGLAAGDRFAQATSNGESPVSGCGF